MLRGSSGERRSIKLRKRPCAGDNGHDSEPSLSSCVGMHYHTLRHSAECMSELGEVASFAGSLEAVELAVWFHDGLKQRLGNSRNEVPVFSATS